MPVILPQLSRREFLKRAALAGAATALAPSSYAGLFGKSRDKNTVFFLSDTHIAGDPAQTYLNVNMTDHLNACIGELAGWPVKPATVIVNGDLAFLAGKPEDYVQFAKVIEPVRALAPVHLSLGNHDERNNFWSAFPHDAKKVKSVPEKQATVFANDRANWFMVDSLQITSKTPGLLGPEQLGWLAHELDARPNKPAIVVVHHNPQFPVVTTGLVDTGALMEVLMPRRQVKAVVFGHTHDWHIVQHESGIHLINLPPTCYPFKELRPAGWVRCALEPDGAQFELRSLDKNHPEHAKVQTLQWRTA